MSLTLTSSPITVVPSILTFYINKNYTHYPIVEFHPIILLSIKVFAFTLEPLNKQVFYSLTPLSTIQFSPTIVSGPKTADGCTFAEGCIITFP